MQVASFVEFGVALHQPAETLVYFGSRLPALATVGGTLPCGDLSLEKPRTIGVHGECQPDLNPKCRQTNGPATTKRLFFYILLGSS